MLNVCFLLPSKSQRGQSNNNGHSHGSAQEIDPLTVHVLLLPAVDKSSTQTVSLFISFF